MTKCKEPTILYAIEKLRDAGQRGTCAMFDYPSGKWVPKVERIATRSLFTSEQACRAVCEEAGFTIGVDAVIVARGFVDGQRI